MPAISDILVVSGGQCGADLGGLLAAEMLGVETGGIAPLGYRTEKGKQPILKTRFNLTEHSSWQYPPRTEENVKLSDVTLIVATNPSSTGTQMTVDFCVKHKKECHVIDANNPDIDKAVRFLNLQDKALTINIAGNRESVSKGLTKKTRQIIYRVIEKYLTIND